MRHQKGRRDCSYNSSLRCLSFTRCLSAILCPIFLKNKLHSFFFRTESAVWLSPLPCCCLPAPLCLSPLKPTHTLELTAPGFAFSLSQPAQPPRSPSAPWETWAELRPLRVLGSVQPWWQLPVLPRSPWHGPWHGRPGRRARTRGTVASAGLRLLPSPGYFR